MFTLGFIAASVAAARAWVGGGDAEPALPPGVCLSEHTPALALGERVEVAALFGQMDEAVPMEVDAASVSAEELVRGLETRGFRWLEGSRWVRARLGGGELVVDVIGPLPRGAINGELAARLGSHDVVYYDGHSYGGALPSLRAKRDAVRARLLILDTCWSLQHWGRAWASAADDVAVIANRERSITGSVESLLLVLEQLEAPSVTRLNQGAERRAAMRRRQGARTPLDRAENYGWLRVCP